MLGEPIYSVRYSYGREGGGGGPYTVSVIVIEDWINVEPLLRMWITGFFCL